MTIFQQLREEVPALEVRRDPLRRSLQMITLAWMFGIIWMTLIGGAGLKTYARMLGFGDFAFGVLGALPFLAAFGQIIGSAIVERTGRTKRPFLRYALPHRLMWIAVAAIPLLLPVPSKWAVAAMLAAVFANWVLAAMSVPAWVMWMGDLIPRRIRGRYIGNRHRLSLMVSIPAVLLTGFLLDWLIDPELPESAAAQPDVLPLLSVLLVAAGLFGAVDIILFIRIREVRPHRELDAGGTAGPWGVRRAVSETLVEPMRDPAFRGYGLFVTMMALSTGSGCFFWLFVLETLGISKLAASILFFLIGPLAGMLTASAWGRGVDRFGRRPILVTSTAIATLALTPYFLASVNTPEPVWLIELASGVAGAVGALIGRPEWTWLAPGAPVGAYLLLSVMAVGGGIGWTGIGVAQTGVMFGFADGPGRSRHVAASAVLSGIGGAIGGLLGGAVAWALADFGAEPIVVGPFVWNHLHGVFVLVFAARGVAVVLACHMPDPGAGSIRMVVRAMGVGAYNTFVLGLFRPWRWVGLSRDRRAANRARRARRARARIARPS